jgi:hypothetical protein
VYSYEHVYVHVYHVVLASVDTCTYSSTPSTSTYEEARRRRGRRDHYSLYIFHVTKTTLLPPFANENDEQRRSPGNAGAGTGPAAPAAAAPGRFAGGWCCHQACVSCCSGDRMADSHAEPCGTGLPPGRLPSPPAAEPSGSSSCAGSVNAHPSPVATRRRGKRAWRKFCWPYLQRVEEIADSLLPPDDRAEGAALVASLNEAAAVGIRPAHGFDVRGARCVCPGRAMRAEVGQCGRWLLLRCRLFGRGHRFEGGRLSWSASLTTRTEPRLYLPSSLRPVSHTRVK